MNTRNSSLAFLLALPLLGCAPSLSMRVQSQCTTRTGPYHFDPMPIPTSPPRREQEVQTSLEIQSIDAQRVSVVIAGSCRVTARLESSTGRPWQPRRRYIVEEGQRCSLPLPEEGTQTVSVNGPARPRDRRILDGPPADDPSWIFVDFNNDVDLLFHGRTPSGVFRTNCRYLAPR